MNHTTLTVTVFSFLVGTLVFAIWSNTHVFAQQLPSSISSSSAAAGNRSSSNSSSNTIPSGLKAKMCDPSNPDLKVVNTTESRICGIPKTVKPSLLSPSPTATPRSSAAASSSSPSSPLPSPQKTTTTTATATKPRTSATNAATLTPKHQQQIVTTNNKNATDASSRSTTKSVAGATLAPVSNPSNKSLLASSSAIAPQVKAINQQQHKQPITRINSTTAHLKAANEQQQLAPSQITLINGTDGQNYASVTSSPTLPSGKLLYLGYHDGDNSNPTNYPTEKNKEKEKTSSSSTKLKTDRTDDSNNNTPKDNNDSAIGSSNHYAKSRTDVDNGPIIGKMNTATTIKSPRTGDTNDDNSSKEDKGSSFDSRSSPHINHGSDASSSSSLSDLSSSIRNEVHSIIKNTVSRIKHNTPFILPFP